MAWQTNNAGTTDRNSLLHNLIAGEQVVEGPLDPSAYASTDTPGIGGARLSALDANASIGLITIDDPEVNFANTLGGNVVSAPLSPIVPEPGSEEGSLSGKSNSAHVYTVEKDDTIASIAAKFNISTNTVLWANGISEKSVINVGDHLTILPITGVLHTVASGDTLLAIANEYDVDAKDVAQYNILSDTGKLSIGQKLIVPDGYIEPRTAPKIAPSGSSRLADEPAPPSIQVDGAGFIWPTTSKHISQYFKWGHTGIDIDNRARPPVYASATGIVEFTGWLGGYGNLIIINHGNGVNTYYAHLDKFYISKGEQVTKGAAIAQMGSTGRSTGPHLHFEVRQNGKPTNPLSMF